MSPNPDAAWASWPNCAVAISNSFRTSACCAWLWLPLLVAMLSGCAQRLPLPSEQPRLQLPMQLHIQARDGTHSEDRLLVIQQEGHALRWTLLNPLGMPLARQLLEEGRWQADGLLPPNAHARELFAALLFALTPTEQLSSLYPAHELLVRAAERELRARNGTHWRVRYTQPERFDLDVGAALTYGVAPLAAPDGASHR